jgi:hypothetical protein
MREWMLGNRGVPTQLVDALADRYAIEREIGRGGMATVYLARDLRHTRSVAVKVLDAELAAVLGVERFLAEIQVTASLQHPNLLPLFDSGVAGGLLYYVMPYVAGESLRARLDREKQLPVEDAVRIASLVAAALEYAHRRGIIHRDLKPENILLQEGQPVIADFGIALAVSNAGGARVTQTGISLGTPQYMSPEQATGDRVIDARTDIYSLGALTYEMLTGEPPHVGSTSQAIIARVLTETPRDIRAARPSVPVQVAAAVNRALEKLPADRWSNAREFADALGDSSSSVSAGTADVRRGRRPLQSLPWVVAGLAIIAGVAVGGWGMTRRPTDALPVHLELDVEPGERVYVTGHSFAWAPDGRSVAYIVVRSNGPRRILVRSFAEPAAREIRGTDDAALVFYSPDGKSIGFLAGGTLQRVDVAGGAPVPLATVADVYGASWVGDDIVVSTLGRLAVVPAAGGPVRMITTPDSAKGENAQLWPLVLEDRETVLYTSWSRAGIEGARIGVASLRSRESRILDLPGSDPIGLIDGRLLYGSATGSLMAIPFDVRRGQPIGTPVPVIEEVVIGRNTGPIKAAVSPTGSVMYMRGTSSEQLLLADSRGGNRPLLTRSRSGFSAPRLSPNGRQIAIGVPSDSGAAIWTFELSTGAFTPLTMASRGRSDGSPEWTPDGKRVVFVSRKDGASTLRWIPADHSGPDELLVGDSSASIAQATISPDGRFIVWYRVVSEKGLGRPLLQTPFAESGAVVSPDGRWVAYALNESGANQVFVTAFPGPGPRHQVSVDGGTSPRWSGDGRRLYYMRGQQVTAATVTFSPSFAVTERITAVQAMAGSGTSSYDVSRDGQQFVLIGSIASDAPPMVVLNWSKGLRSGQ